MSSIPIDFKSSEEISRQETLLYNIYTKQFTLDEPGVYDFKVSMTLNLINGESQEYTSNVIQITVDEPINDDKLALKELRKLQLGDFLNGLNSQPLYAFEGIEETAERAILFVKKYRNSLYAPLVSRQIKTNLNYVKRELELTKQSNGGELPSELENTYNNVKTMIELEVDEN